MYIFCFKNNFHRHIYGSYSYSRISKRLTSTHGQFSRKYLDTKIKKENHKIQPYGSTQVHTLLSEIENYDTPLMSHWITTESSEIAMFLRLGVEEFVNSRSSLKFVKGYNIDFDVLKNKLIEIRDSKRLIVKDNQKIYSELSTTKSILSTVDSFTRITNNNNMESLTQIKSLQELSKIDFNQIRIDLNQFYHDKNREYAENNSKTMNTAKLFDDFIKDYELNI